MIKKLALEELLKTNGMENHASSNLSNASS